MSRSGYTNSGDQWAAIRWGGALASAFRGRRGQAFLRELIAALDVVPGRRLVTKELIAGAEVCALGAVGVARGLDMSEIDPEDYNTVAGKFDVAEAMAREIMYQNDEGTYRAETPEERWTRVRTWVASCIKDV